jgi:SAM-dependent methyltransferase
LSHEPTGEAAGLFGAVSEAYAAHRPTYPEGFFATFVSRCPGRERVWDCGCGSGQASLALAQHFDQVVATDASSEQLQLAPQHPRIRWLQAQAHCAPLDPASVDAVLVAAAVHWFAGEAFNTEVRRVARPGAVMAWIGYLPLRLEQPDLQRQLDRFYGSTLEPWWPPQRRWVDQRYAGLPFPGEEWPFPSDQWIERHWNLSDLLGYLASWSAVSNARRSGVDPLQALEPELRRQWPAAGAQPLLVRWPFMGRWGVIHA